MSTWYLPASVFLLVILLILLVLLVVYLCVKNGRCCFDRPKADVDDLDYVTLATEDSDNESFFNKPYLLKTIQLTENEHAQGESDHVQTDDSLMSYTSVKTAPETDSLVDQVDNKQVQEEILDDAKIRITLLYSKADLFLMLTINEVTGIPVKANSGYDHIKVSIVLLPEKKYRSKTKYAYVKENSTTFNDSFKFSNVSRENLFSSAFRFRLYGKKKIGKEVLLGEMIVQLADVAQRAGGFMTWRAFQRKRK